MFSVLLFRYKSIRMEQLIPRLLTFRVILFSWLLWWARRPLAGRMTPASIRRSAWRLRDTANNEFGWTMWWMSNISLLLACGRRQAVVRVWDMGQWQRFFKRIFRWMEVVVFREIDVCRELDDRSLFEV